MDTHLVLTDPDRVGAFVADGIGRSRPWWNFSAIGIERGGILLAGVVFELFVGESVQGHIASLPRRFWATFEFFHAVFQYVFVQLGARYFYVQVSSANRASRRLVEHLGFKLHTTLPGGTVDGDLLIYVMQPEWCRYLDQGEYHG